MISSMNMAKDASQEPTPSSANVHQHPMASASPDVHRRVIFPFLHTTTPSPSSTTTDKPNRKVIVDSCLPIPDEQEFLVRLEHKPEELSTKAGIIMLPSVVLPLVSREPAIPPRSSFLAKPKEETCKAPSSPRKIQLAPIPPPVNMVRTRSAPPASFSSQVPLRTPPQPLRSILRSRAYSVGEKPTLEYKHLPDSLSCPPFAFSNSSPVPSLVSLKDEEEDDSQSSCSPEGASACLERSSSDLGLPPPPSFPTRAISFDPRVWVREFDRTDDEKQATWYTLEDLENFRKLTLTRILEFHTRGKSLLSTGTGRLFARPIPMTKALYTNPALTLESEEKQPDDEDLDDDRRNGSKAASFKNSSSITPFERAVLECEIRQVLLVDPHDICLQLLTKSLQRILPHATIVTARTSADALRLFQQQEQGFDVVLVEERLHHFYRQAAAGGAASPQLVERHRTNVNNNDEARVMVSGSSLIRKMQELSTLSSPSASYANPRCHRDVSLFIGMSAHLEQGDRLSLEESGSDLVWSKPPPTMNAEVRQTLLRTILLKRGRRALATALFRSTTG